jgi:hypothetical protein
MGTISDPDPAVLIAGIMYSDEILCDKAIAELIGRFGDIELRSESFPFDMTDYYTPEMGQDIKKKFICFHDPVEMSDLPAIKHTTNRIESEFAFEVNGKIHRQVNIDPGYVTLAKLVLASTKDYSHRIYLAQGIYGETTLRYIRDTFTSIDTTYPDYRTPLAIGFFNSVRDYLKRSKGTWMTKPE